MNNPSRKMKGFEPLIAATLLVAIALMAAIIIYQWQISYVDEYTTGLKTSTDKQLMCDRVDIDFISASYNCANSCSQGIGHALDVKLKNYGSVGVDISKIYLKSNSGTLSEYPGGHLDIGETKNFVNMSTASCSEIYNNIEEMLVITDCSNLFLSIPADKIQWIDCK
ncbi:MAG: hypothetical protein HZB65_01880 [Candidatus Aenigmarchaeota archaeon]|nr:hypothetical protein [Candidatus Aenigmarchaeota archaeon]